MLGCRGQPQRQRQPLLQPLQRVDEKDADGGIAPAAEQTVMGLVQKFMGAGPAPRGASPTDQDASITAYSEEGLR